MNSKFPRQLKKALLNFSKGFPALNCSSQKQNVRSLLCSTSKTAFKILSILVVKTKKAGKAYYYYIVNKLKKLPVNICSHLLHLSASFPKEEACPFKSNK